MSKLGWINLVLVVALIGFGYWKWWELPDPPKALGASSTMICSNLPPQKDVPLTMAAIRADLSDGSSVTVSFRYYPVWQNPRSESRTTEATVRIQNAPDEPVDEFQGWTSCHPSDNFSKERGRKLALRRALVVSGLDPEDRKAVWQAYLGRSPRSRNKLVNEIVNILHQCAEVINHA